MTVAEPSNYPTTFVTPTASYFVCYTSRSGSTLLCDALAASGLAGLPEEYFNPRAKATLGECVWEEDWKAPDLPTTLQHLMTRGTTTNRVFGSKLLWSELLTLSDRLRSQPGNWDKATAELMADTFPSLRYIWVTRRDKVRQAVSLFRARQSDQWIRKSDDDQRSGNLKFDFRLIDSLRLDIVHTEAAWAQFFVESKIVPYTVVYEDLVLSYEPTVRQVLNYLQVPLPSSFHLPPPKPKRQADETSEEWVRRYYEANEVRRVVRNVASVPSVLCSRPLWRNYIYERLRNKLTNGV